MRATITRFAAVLALMALPAAAWAQGAGKSVYDQACTLCHASGVAGAPRLGNAADWLPRISKGMPALYKSALEGTAAGMPAKGGRVEIRDADIRAAVDFMVAAAKSARPEGGVLVLPPRASPPAPVPAAAVATTGDAAAEVNSFNRLLRPPARRNAPPSEDGIHDPTNDGTAQLQPPLLAFGALPKSIAGNRVNWVAALDQKRIEPRWDRNDPKAGAVVMDLNIVREVKGSMPDVLYPHKQHTEWLDCSNCHPAIFVPQKGANQISMAAILLGQKCGVCHGKVAFPVSECRLCHSQKKDFGAAAPRAASQ